MYHTKQNDLVLDCLKERSGHMTAQEVIRALSEAGHNVGAATVYRRLDHLVETGEVRKFVVDEKMGACYQYAGGGDCQTHSHLMCIRCGKLIHLSCHFINELDEHILREHGFRVDVSRTVFYGVCAECAKGDDL